MVTPAPVKPQCEACQGSRAIEPEEVDISSLRRPERALNFRTSVPNTQSHGQKPGDTDGSDSPFSPYRDDVSQDESRLKTGVNWENYSVASHELFEEGKDDIIFEGEVMKFKPGISMNFIPRYV